MLELAPLLVSALILGLLGGGHCLGMCGGLMGALTLAIPKEQRSRRFRFGLLGPLDSALDALVALLVQFLEGRYDGLPHDEEHQQHQDDADHDLGQVMGQKRSEIDPGLEQHPIHGNHVNPH